MFLVCFLIVSWFAEVFLGAVNSALNLTFRLSVVTHILFLQSPSVCGPYLYIHNCIHQSNLPLLLKAAIGERMNLHVTSLTLALMYCGYEVHCFNTNCAAVGIISRSRKLLLFAFHQIFVTSETFINRASEMLILYLFFV
jgi:hypothetical protein